MSRQLKLPYYTSANWKWNEMLHSSHNQVKEEHQTLSKFYKMLLFFLFLVTLFLINCKTHIRNPYKDDIEWNINFVLSCYPMLNLSFGTRDPSNVCETALHSTFHHCSNCQYNSSVQYLVWSYSVHEHFL